MSLDVLAKEVLYFGQCLEQDEQNEFTWYAETEVASEIWEPFSDDERETKLLKHAKAYLLQKTLPFTSRKK